MEQDLTVFAAPFAIGVGGGLLALGGLSLFGYQYLFQTKTQAVLGICAGLVILGAMEVKFFSSSSLFLERQKVVVSDCHVEAENANPGKRGTQDPDINKSLAACLNRAGYEWSGEHRRCKDAPLAMNVYCYLPKGFFDRLVTNIQLVFE
jgi:hypothetical protein